MGNMMNAVNEFVGRGGFTAFFMIIAAVVLIVASIERLTFLYFRFSFQAGQTLLRIREAVLHREYTKALQICNDNPTAPQLSVMRAGLIAVEHGREAMRSALGGAVLLVSRRCERRVPIIALIASVATLLGLLGTINGLIKTFQSLALVDASKKGELLGLGISEAMYSTAAGLAVGITAMVVHTLCVSKGDHIVGESQEAGYKLITWVEESERSRANG